MEANIKETLEVEDDDDDDDDKDRISNLPDHILTHILSFLPTKYAVGTSILSTRWKYLFTTIPNLDFDDSLTFIKSEERFVPRKRYNRFINFVYRVLLLLRNTSNVTKLRLNCHIEYDESHVSAWICAVLLRNVQQLHICIPMKEICPLPRDIFICRSLVVLKLGYDFVVNVPSSVCLPNLKVLSLSYITFTDEDSIQRVFSGCPVLEDLKLNACPMENFQNLEISVPSLNSLLLCCREDNFEFVLDTPILERFEYNALPMGGCTIKHVKSLVKAHLTLMRSDEQLEHDGYRYAQYAAKTVNDVNNVKFLYLSGETLEALECSCRLLPTFHNLTHLELGVNCNGWQLLPNLLESSPILEVLVFFEGFMDCYAEQTEFPYCLPEHVPICLSQHLKEVEIMDFGGEEDELKLVEYFLKNGEVLKRMTIKSFEFDCPVPERIPRAHDRILLFPRCLQTCQIVVI